MKNVGIKKFLMRILSRRMIRFIISAKNLCSSRLVPGPLTYNYEGLATRVNCDFMKDKKFMDSYNLGKATGSWESYNLYWRLYVVCWAAKKGKDTPGDFVECGVYKGGFARAVINYTDFQNLPKKYYLLDTFEGLCDEHISAEERIIGIDRYSYRYEKCYDVVKDTFKQFSNVEIIKGLVPDTLPSVKTDKVSFLSIDMNCAFPEIAAIEFFWDKLVSGAIVVLDDYGSPNHIVQKREFDKFASRKGIDILSLPTGQGLIFKS
jgi:O-methyltransferase